MPASTVTSVKVVGLVSGAVVQDELVVGYGTQQRADITGSVSEADPEALRRASQSSIAGALEGQTAGRNVQTSGAPGASNFRPDANPMYWNRVDLEELKDIVDYIALHI